MALLDMLNNKIKRGYKNLETILHTDQGSVYSSISFNNILKPFFITRSMSRIGTPTDNPIIESKNGWLKNEMYIDFDINNYSTVQEFIEDVVKDNNEYRPSYALNYKTPIEYRIQLGFP
jgi:transposase InsO family protein